MNIFVTAISAATGGDNAKIDISIDENTLTPAKNTTFVTTGYDQSITEMKTLTRTTISNGIQYSGYDNSSIFLAGGGVKSVFDINTSINLSNYYNKTQTYSQTETSNNFLNNKANTAVSYTKSEVDTLPLLKADKTQLIDSYTKTETDNPLNNKANQSTTYTKTETNQLTSDIDVGDVDLTDYCYKTKTEELLGEKLSTTYFANYVTLGTSQAITANKTFNNACIFVSSIDGLSTVTGSSFIKSGADNTVVLLGAGATCAAEKSALTLRIQLQNLQISIMYNTEIVVQDMSKIIKVNGNYYASTIRLVPMEDWQISTVIEIFQ
ncbi:MAG: hypothetical protein EZS28_027138 [Streblomastix strix]|uniref:Uncharacterized protein n=1 Tax=Streblomastix strix TaxID=222440 RepID=A0A5J4V5D8_9EUKA|nr:MAG: hypothetical protein EZS28_027138 [Streblomastix strix]